MIKVTILTGFLGSGKTSLIKHLLQNETEEKIAIIENEFGEVNIDGLLLENQENLTLVELSNGCICCSIRGELTDALLGLLSQIQSATLTIDRVILETTGLADPAPIIQAFFVDDVVREHFELDAVVTLVDALHIQQQLDEHNVVAAQIGFADVLLVTKSEDVAPENLTAIYHRIGQINNKADIILSHHGVLAKSAWLDLNAFTLNEAMPVSRDCKPIKPNSYFKSNHSDQIQSYLLEAQELDMALFDAFMEKLIAQYGNDMLRYKGVFAVNGTQERLIVQGVHNVVGFDYGSVWQAQEERRSKMVIIARSLPFERIKTEFLDCVVG